MPKAKREDVKSPKLYHGTSEIKAKEACVNGLFPYEVKDVDYYGIPRRIHASSPDGISLTSSYPGLMAFETSSHKEKWGIIEIDVSHLSPEVLVPYEGFLLEKMKTKISNEEDRFKKLTQIRQNLPSNHRKWRESLDDFGMCVYEGFVPLAAISRVVIYDPQSNPVMTKAIIGSALIGTKFHQSGFQRQQMLTRWLLGENITPEEWMGSSVYSKMEHLERDQIGQVLRNKHGLDIYYSGVPNGKKISWW